MPPGRTASNTAYSTSHISAVSTRPGRCLFQNSSAPGVSYCLASRNQPDKNRNSGTPIRPTAMAAYAKSCVNALHCTIISG